MSAVQRLMALDGLRGISILLVVISHVLVPTGIKYFPGGLGVTIFFFISGFIITRLLLQESVNTGQVLLSAFYQRRILRLAPALLVYVLVCCVSFTAIGGQIPLSDVAATIFYYANYHNIFTGFSIGGYAGLPVQPLSITWSLAVEEHFYFLFPIVLVGLCKQPGRLLAVLALFVLATLIWRLVLVFGIGLPKLRLDRIYMASDTRLDSIAYGCLLSVMFHRADAAQGRIGARLLDRLSQLPALAASAVLLILTLLLRSDAFRESLRYSIQGIALMPLFCALFWSGEAPRWIRAALESRILVFIGAISYSIYLYHFLGLALAYALFGQSAAAIIGFTLVFGLLGALASYYWIENPVRRLGTRYIRQSRPRLSAV